MNLKQLRVFLGVVESGSFSAAADKLHLSQSVISRHVQALEDTLDSMLLDRLPRGIETTEAGAVLADYARRLFTLEGEAQTAVEELRDLRAGRLRIGASMTIGNYLLPRLLAVYHHRHPQVHVELSIANTQAIQLDLSERRIDLGLTEGFVDDETFSVRIFMEDEMIPVTAGCSPLASRQALTLAEMAEHPCVMREPGSGTRAVVEEALTRHGVRIREAMSLGSAEAVKQAVMAGTGFTIASHHTVKPELASGQLVRLHPADFRLQRPLHLLKLRHRRPTRAVEAFIRLLDGETAGEDGLARDQA